MSQLLIRMFVFTALVVIPAIFAEVVLSFLKHIQGFNERIIFWLGAGVILIVSIILFLAMAKFVVAKTKNTKL